MIQTPPGNFYPVNFDHFPDCYAYEFKEIKIDDCDWFAYVSEEGMIRIELHINGELVGVSELELIDVEGIPEFEPSEYQVGWSAGIDVEEPFRLAGVGKHLWQVGDLVLQQVHGQEQVRIFINASTNNPWFARSIFRKVQVLFVSMDGDFVYLLR